MASDKQTVCVHLTLSGDGFGTDAERQRIFELEDVMTAAIQGAGVGEFDGNGFGFGGVDLFADGPDADALYAAMEPSIRAYGPSPGSSVVLSYGRNADSPSRSIELP